MHDTAGAPIAGARVMLTDALSDEERVGAAAADGSFRFGMLPPGAYTLWVEELGFLPRRILGLSVRRGREVRVPVELMPIDPPVMRIDTALSDGPVLENDPLSRSFAHLELVGLPDAARDLAQLTSFAAWAGDALEIAGLPGWASGVVVNGLPFRGIRHPFLDDPTRLALFPLSAFDRVALLRDDPDVEWSGFGGGWLLADQRRAPPRIEVSLFGDWTGDALASSARFAQDVPSFRTVRGGVRIGGPILADTAHFVVGAEATRIRTPRARPWRGSGLDEALIASADSLGVELSSLLGTQVEETDLVSVFGRFDWRLGRAQAVSVQANVASVAGQGLNAGPDATWSPRTSVDGTDVNVTVSLTSDWGAVANELRVGFERAGRDYGADTLPATRFVAAGLGFGNDVRFPARFERSGLRVRETFHVRVANHRMKIGVEVDLTSFDQSFASGTAGEYVFSGVSGLDARRGVFTQAVGPRPVASFSRQSIGGFMQDHWTVAPGFDFRVGLRYDVELVPLDEIPPNAEWFERTGLSNDSLDGSRGKVSSRAGFTWDVGETGRWIVTAGAGIYYDFIDPALLGELLSHTGRIEVRRGVGDLTSWPASPPDAAAPIIGPRLTLIAPGLEPPRSGKASFGVTRAFGRSTAFHVSTSFRHTDFLPRRRDLNLLPSPAAM
ncbi:MAG: TonB-dependent receptor, partial [Gemmatimonadetes bacterium]|nr:TonB-dependent receptor [Gemmatimonadota bacterium]